MTRDVDIRDTASSDFAALDALYPAAFPDEDLLGVVHALSQDRADVLSLVAVDGSGLAGHVAFTRCAVAGADAEAALLGPLAVSPDRQRQGIGRALVEAGAARMTQAGVALICVLGDPAYYSKLGFTPERDIAPPYPLPQDWRDAWQSLRLDRGASQLRGVLNVPAPWDAP